jgi:predicted transcriptional regulator
VPTCRVDEPIDEVRQRVRAAGWDACVVVNEQRVVFGLLRRAELETESDGSVEHVMRPGPSTFRPHVSIEEMALFMQRHGLESSPITTSDGRLVGLLREGTRSGSPMSSMSTTPNRRQRRPKTDEAAEFEPGNHHLHNLRHVR